LIIDNRYKRNQMQIKKEQRKQLGVNIPHRHSIFLNQQFVWQMRGLKELD